MINFLSLLKLIPKQVWFIIGALMLYMASLYYIKGLGYSEGYLEAEAYFNEESQKLLKEDLNEINLNLTKILEKKEMDSKAIGELIDSISVVEESTNEYKELLNEAKNSTLESDCVLSGEYIRLFKSIYPSTDR